MERREWVSRYAKDIIKKACVPEDIANEMAEDAFDEFGSEDSPEDSVDSELSYWGE